MRVAVLTGDIRTDADARRLERYGFPVRQIATAGACRLDARIESAGNLACATSYDLGRVAKVVLLSVAEGEETPIKSSGTFSKSKPMV